jgi:3-oxoacyl-[acyl-carrier-protein] synthase III
MMQAAIADAGIKAENIDLVIVATSSPDDMFGDAPSVAAGLCVCLCIRARVVLPLGGRGRPRMPV